MEHFISGLVVGTVAALVNFVIFLLLPLRSRLRTLEKMLEGDRNEPTEAERLACVPLKRRHRTMFTEDELGKNQHRED